MSIVADDERVFKIGTLGWTADDLDDPRFERLWEQGRYEIVEGVLTEMPPAQFDAGDSLIRLMALLQRHCDEKDIGGSFAIETDIIISRRKVAVADAVYLTQEQLREQASLYAKRPNRRPEVQFGRLMVAPTLVVEAVSLGHEAHDRETKFNWYADAGVMNYWLLYSYRRSLECYSLKDGQYVLEASGKADEQITPSLFPDLKVNLAELWRSMLRG